MRLLLQVAENLLPAGPAAVILTARRVQVHPHGGPGGGEHLLLLGPQLGRLEGGGLLHGGQRQQLEQVILDDVPRGPDAVVVAGPATDADVFGHGDLHMIDVVVVPHRLEQLVGEPQRHHVLHGFLAQIVIDAEHRRGREHARDDPVQLLGTGQIVTERLLDHHSAPAAGLLVGEALFAELVDHGLEQPGRDGQVEGVVATGTPGLVQLGDRLAQPYERVMITDLAGDEADALGQLPPDLLPERSAGVLP